MPIPAGDVHVGSGVGASSTTGRLTPLVELTVSTEGPMGGERKATIWMSPAKARGVGLDLIAAANHAATDTAIREVARERGLDGDSIIGRVRVLAEIPPDG